MQPIATGIRHLAATAGLALGLAAPAALADCPAEPAAARGAVPVAHYDPAQQVGGLQQSNAEILKAQIRSELEALRRDSRAEFSQPLLSWPGRSVSGPVAHQGAP